MDNDPAMVAAEKIWSIVFQFGGFSTLMGTDIAQIIRDAYAETLEELAFRPLGDNHHNAAACPHCGSLLAAKDAEIERLTRWIDDLQSGMYVNCVYCGHRYGPGETTPVSMAEALKSHIEICPEHPMSRLKADRDLLDRLLRQNAEDWADTDTNIRESARRVLGEYVDGDSTCVPPVEEIVERLVNKVEELRRLLSGARSLIVSEWPGWHEWEDHINDIDAALKEAT